MTPEQIDAAIRDEFPAFPVSEGKAAFTVSPDELPEVYEAMVADRVRLELAAQEEAGADFTHEQMLRQFVDGMETLRNDLGIVQNRIANNTNLTQAEIRIGFRDLLQAVIWIGDRIGDGKIMTRR